MDLFVKGSDNNIVLLSGLSGSGKSVAIKALEDLDFFCIDNLSPIMIVDLISSICQSKESTYNKIAISIDIRSIKMDKNPKDSIEKLYESLKKMKMKNSTIFLHSSSKVLISRFNATRRLHPLANNKLDLQSALNKESEIMQDLKENASLIIDTDNLLPNELKKEIINSVKFIKNKNDILIQLQSFGYKNNIPNNSDFVFDVRCLKNPFWQKKLRILSGKNMDVIKFIESDESAITMEKSIISFLSKWIPKFIKNDRHYMTISIGCTGGQHRSVYMVEKVYRQLMQKYNNILIKHRDIK
ncbi:MAG: RNase adapter RapZ [Gammaproteobacteria bacterium]|nr:RNase adapter RapZ [Gammaproteobacteria bacterium]